MGIFFDLLVILAQDDIAVEAQRTRLVVGIAVISTLEAIHEPILTRMPSMVAIKGPLQLCRFERCLVIKLRS